MQNTAETSVDPLSVHVFHFAAKGLVSEAQTSAFSLYEDDGISTAYDQGQFERTAPRLRQTRDSVRSKSENGDGNYRSVAQRGYQLHFQGFRSPYPAQRQRDRASIVAPDRKLDDRRFYWRHCDYDSATCAEEGK